MQGPEYSGCCYQGNLSTVSILRAGEVLEPAISAVCKDIRMGKILIQTNEHSGEPEVGTAVLHLRLGHLLFPPSVLCMSLWHTSYA